MLDTSIAYLADDRPAEAAEAAPANAGAGRSGRGRRGPLRGIGRADENLASVNSGRGILRNPNTCVPCEMTHFLANDENPEGYKLEDVLSLVRQDVIKRLGKIAHDGKPEALQVIKNDIVILNLLTECIEIAHGSTELLNKSFGPSNPAKPRIGVR